MRKMLQNHSLKDRKTCDTCNTCKKMSYVSLGVLLFSSLDTCDTCDTCDILQYFAIFFEKEYRNISHKNAVVIFFGISKNMQYLRLGTYHGYGSSGQVLIVTQCTKIGTTEFLKLFFFSETAFAVKLGVRARLYTWHLSPFVELLKLLCSTSLVVHRRSP